MEFLHITATDKTPEIKLDFKTGDLSIHGRSIINQQPDFYNTLIQALDQYCANPAPVTIAHVQLDYFGDKSSKSLLEIFKRLESIHRKKSDVYINWYYSYEDKEMRETGEDYENLLNIPFRLVELADEI
jgi:histidinol phosphatase-like PHP family hydrolase